MPYLRDRAIVLRSEPFREHDRRIVLFGMQHGLLETVARGASAQRAKQGGHLTPFSEVEVMVAKGAAFDKLAVARVVRARPSIRRRLGSLVMAGAFADFFERMQRPGIVDASSYALLRDVLETADALPDDPSAERAQLLHAAACLKLMDRVGYAPPLSACASCREGFSADGGDVWLVPLEGAFYCADCFRLVRRANPGVEPVTVQTLGLVRFLRREPLDAILSLTGSPDAFRSASGVVSLFLQQAPLSRRPHGNETILAFLA